MPDVPPGNLRDLIAELHALHLRAGLPGVRVIAKKAGFSHTAVHDLLTTAHRRPPNIQLVHAVTAVLSSMARGVDGDEMADWMDRTWRAAAETPFEPESGVESSGSTGEASFRPASRGAQPFVVDRLVTTVFMKGRSAVRRITERVVTAQADGVEFYTARSFSGRDTSGRDYVPVQALWGCQAEVVPNLQPSDPVVTRLRFPRALRRGEQAQFASEALFAAEPAEYDKDWLDVDIDHHGIVTGSSYFSGAFPLSGLTIRVRFDLECLPTIVWWYAESTEKERTDVPDDDERLLEVVSGEVSYTFTGVACQPRENYGIGWQWPSRS